MVKRVIATLGLALLGTSAALAGPRLEFDIVDKVSFDTEKIDSTREDKKVKGMKGQGELEEQVTEFYAKITSREFKPISGIKVRAYVYSEDPFSKNSNFALAKTFELKDLTVEPGKTLESKLGEASFTQASSASTSSRLGMTTVRVYQGGRAYGGWAAEFYLDGELLGVEFKNKDSKEAYNKRASKSKEKKKKKDKKKDKD